MGSVSEVFTRQMSVVARGTPFPSAYIRVYLRFNCSFGLSACGAQAGDRVEGRVPLWIEQGAREVSEGPVGSIQP